MYGNGPEAEDALDTTNNARRGREPHTRDETDELVLSRLRGAQGLEQFRKKVYDLRRIVAGDLSPLTPAPVADEDNPQQTTQPQTLSEFCDFIVTYYHEGRSNKILQAIKTLLMQTSLNFPEIEFQDLSPNLAALNAQYCKVRLGESPLGCNARDHMRLALLDYMISGIGWVKVCVRNDQPVVMSCDSLDMTWDRSVRLPTDIRWASCRYREPLGTWVSMFGPQNFKDLEGDVLATDHLVELEWYYDIEGPAGHWYVVRTDNQEIVHRGTNPYWFEVNGQTQIPYLPYEPMYYMALPSHRVPIGIVEMMLPNQIALWEAEDNIRTTIQRGAPFYQVAEGSLDPEEEKRFEDGDIGTLVKYRPNGTPIAPVPGIQVSSDLIRWRDMHNNELPGQSGANPYAAGAPVAGVSYAAEVNAIQGNAGLVAGNIAKDSSAFWQRATKKFLAAARLYDDQPIRLRVDQVDLYFNEQNPISQFVVPDAEIIVSETSMNFRPREQKILSAYNELKTALEVAQLFPKAPALAFERYLRAIGEQNVSDWLEQPAPAQPQQAAAAGANPAQQQQMMDMIGQVMSGAEANTQTAA